MDARQSAVHRLKPGLFIEACAFLLGTEKRHAVLHTVELKDAVVHAHGQFVNRKAKLMLHDLKTLLDDNAAVVVVHY
jgi:hypothetical protein